MDYTSLNISIMPWLVIALLLPLTLLLDGCLQKDHRDHLPSSGHQQGTLVSLWSHLCNSLICKKNVRKNLRPDNSPELFQTLFSCHFFLFGFCLNFPRRLESRRFLVTKNNTAFWTMHPVYFIRKKRSIRDGDSIYWRFNSCQDSSPILLIWKMMTMMMIRWSRCR